MRVFIFVSILLFGFSKSEDVNCATDQFKCNDGKCILQIWLCDGARDCPDGSDEAHEACDKHANRDSPCFGNQPECLKHGSMRCIPHEWLCDGHPDCDKGEDEANCSTVRWFRPPESLLENYHRKFSTKTSSSPNDYCQYGEFRCNTSGECVKRDKVCDGKTDCVDGSDEKMCEDNSEKNMETSALNGKESRVLSTSAFSTPSSLGSSTNSGNLVSSQPVHNTSTTSSTTSTTTTRGPVITEWTSTPKEVPPTTTSVLTTTSISRATNVHTTSSPTSTKSILLSSTGSSSSLADSLKLRELVVTTTPSSIQTTKSTSHTSKGLYFTMSRTSPITVSSTHPTTTHEDVPFLIKAIQPPIIQPKNFIATSTTLAPTTTNLFSNASASPVIEIPRHSIKLSDVPKPILPEVKQTLSRESRSSANSTNMTPVKFFKGVPIEPVHPNSTDYEAQTDGAQ